MRLFNICSTLSYISLLGVFVHSNLKDEYKRRKNKKVIYSKQIKETTKPDFELHRDLYIEKRKKTHLTTTDVFNYLIKNDFLRAGLEFQCSGCKLDNWYSLKRLDDSWICEFCGEENKTSLHINTRGDWKFRKSGLFAKDNNQEGAIPVILTILVFESLFSLPSNLIYTTSLNLTSCEIDFLVCHYGHYNKIQIAIGECKDEGGQIDKNDIDNLKEVRNQIESIGLECYIVLSKAADYFKEEEIHLFKDLHKECQKLILLTNKELEPITPYFDLNDSAGLPDKYVVDMEGMARNSFYLYLR